MHDMFGRIRHLSLRCILLWIAGAGLGLYPAPAAAAADDIVLYSSDVTRMSGAWTRVSSKEGAGGEIMTTPDQGFTAASPLASPTHFFEVKFEAAAGTSYHVWLRLRAAKNQAANDSVWVQFSDALDQADKPVWRIGTASALLVNLESCQNCGVSGWGWQDGAFWITQDAVVRFPTTGTHTMRIQTREDGVQVDQIVLSPASYMSSSPGALLNDATILSKTTTSATTMAQASAPEIVLYAADATAW
ncbi:MAG TPA: hypothetical protein VNK41_08500, partial [Vicinamibacterales bacterium]|nr:hypothetical protein [Vicinamibacterales bacterium]